jgi:hypothetical protein
VLPAYFHWPSHCDEDDAWKISREKGNRRFVFNDSSQSSKHRIRGCLSKCCIGILRTDIAHDTQRLIMCSVAKKAGESRMANLVPSSSSMSLWTSSTILNGVNQCWSGGISAFVHIAPICAHFFAWKGKYLVQQQPIAKGKPHVSMSLVSQNWPLNGPLARLLKII